MMQVSYIYFLTLGFALSESSKKNNNSATDIFRVSFLYIIA